MRGTYLPIHEFLPMIIRASGDVTYAGIAVVLDREAEQSSRLLDDIVAEASSIDDVTGSSILVIVPAQKHLATNRFNPFILDPEKGYEDGVTAPGIYVPALVNSALRKAVWEAAAPRVDEIYDEIYIPQHAKSELRKAPWWEATFAGEELYKPEKEEAFKKAITQSVTKTREYIGLSEDDVPSLVILCLQEKQIIVLRYGELDKAYSFFKQVMSKRPAHTVDRWLSEAAHAVASNLDLSELDLSRADFQTQPANELSTWRTVRYLPKGVDPIALSPAKL